jgi:two-component system, cell cycle sensor histidine kinase and response regulator CckA
MLIDPPITPRRNHGPPPRLCFETDTRYVLVNNAYEEFSGVNQDDFVGMTVAEYLGSDIFEEKIKANLDKCLNGEIVNYREWFEYPTKGKRFVDITYYPYLDGDRNIGGVIANTRDITEIKHSERDWERVRYSLDNLTESVFWVGDDGYFIDCNYTACKRLGYSRDELLKMHVSDVDSLVLQEGWQAHWEEMKSRGIVMFETVHRAKSGQSIPMEVVVHHQQYGGSHFNCVLGRDITERKQVEEDLRRSRDLLTATEALSAVGGWEWDVATQSMVWTDGTYHIHGFESSAVPVGSPEHIERSLACYDPEDQSRVEEAFRRCVEEGEPYDLECDFTTAQGRRLCVRTMGRAIREGGRTVKVMGNLQDISDRKRAEEDLRERELRFQHMLSLVPDMISIHDPDMTILYSNWKGFGAVPEERQNLKTKCYKTYRGYDDICPDCQAKTVIETRKSFQTEEHLPDGRWIDLRVIPFLDETGEVEFFLEWVRDITNRKRAEETLRESEETHRALVDGLPDIVMRFDREGRHMFVSDNVREVADVEAAHFIGKTHAELGFPEPLCRLWEESIQRVFDSSTPFETEFAVEGKTGVVTFEWRLVPERDAQGAVASVLSISRDVTAHRKAEQEYKTLFREMLDGFALHEIICDAEGEPVDYRFLAVNPAFERMTGLKAEAIVGRTVLEVLPGTERHWIETYGKVALSGEPVFFEDYAAEQGKFFEVTAFRPSAGEFACVFQDITEHKRAEEERERLQAQLTQAQKMESVGRLAGGVAHDFNNMLGVIIGHADLILEQMDPGQPFHADLTEIRKAGERSAHLTRQLLAFARKQTIAPKVLDLNDTLRGMLNMLQRLIGEDIDLSWRPGKELWAVKMDPAQIDQILANLCVNARDAIADVGKVTIETGNAVFDEEYCSRNTGFFPGEYVLLAVSDNGCGMDAETLSHLFEPFFSTKESGKGTGLGLATVYGVVLRFTPTDGCGCTPADTECLK